MSNIRVNAITDEAGTGAPDFPNGYTVAGAVPAAPESGVQTFTATGALANGDLVGLNPDGTVSVVSPYAGADSSYAYVTGSGGFSSSFSILDTFNNKFVLFYSINYKPYAVVATVVGSDITFGTPVTFATTYSEVREVTFDNINNKIVFIYQDGTTSTPRVSVATVTGTSITINSTTSIIGSSGIPNSLTFDPVSGKVVILYSPIVAPYPQYAVVGTVSGSSISLGASVLVSSTSTLVGAIVRYEPTSNKHIIFYKNGSSAAKVRVGTVSGTSITLGTESSSPIVVASTFLIALDTVGGRGIFITIDTANKVFNYFFGTISGTDITFSATKTVAYLSPEVSNTSKLVQITSSNLALTSGYIYLPLLVFGDDLIVEEHKVVYMTANWSAGAVYNGNTESILLYSANSTTLFCKVVDPNSVARSFIGITAEAIADGASGKITVTGGVNSGQTGLLPSSPYGYNSDAGTLIRGGSNLGIALSPTQLYIK
jgi:hypothetical protein